MTSNDMIARGPAPPTSLPPLLLCIDDDEMVLGCVASVLEANGYRTLSASCGLLGIQLFKRNAIDLVVVDHDMPEMNGCEVAEELRRLDPKVPIIMCSGSPENSARAGLLVDAFIPKGTEFSFLLSAIGNLHPLEQQATTLTGDLR